MSACACRRALRHAQSDARGRENQPRPAADGRARQPELQAWLGPREGAPAPPSPPQKPYPRCLSIAAPPTLLSFSRFACAFAFPMLNHTRPPAVSIEPRHSSRLPHLLTRSDRSPHNPNKVLFRTLGVLSQEQIRCRLSFEYHCWRSSHYSIICSQRSRGVSLNWNHILFSGVESYTPEVNFNNHVIKEYLRLSSFELAFVHFPTMSISVSQMFFDFNIYEYIDFG